MTNLDSILKSRHYFADKGLYSQSCGFSCSHVWMWELDHKESWALKNWCFQPVVLEKSPLDSKEIKEVNPKGHQSEYSLERLSWSWSSNNLATWCKELTHWKRPWCWEKLKAGEGDNRGWDGWMASPTQWHEFEQALGDGEGQGSLACCSPWSRKESDMTEWLNNNSSPGR